MPDRFSDGDGSNNYGGLDNGDTDKDILHQGYDPTKKPTRKFRSGSTTQCSITVASTRTSRARTKTKASVGDFVVLYSTSELEDGEDLE
ncbi:hypothetical protein [Rubrobacter indicoceani]|uniref:hypothetical protein n=1 Tax=Rubrobacter indicoceani TaxID=2051957 RepID=UPI000E5AED63|nr:hypothetical protein [Rubrobacter indicoceani]